MNPKVDINPLRTQHSQLSRHEPSCNVNRQNICLKNPLEASKSLITISVAKAFVSTKNHSWWNVIIHHYPFLEPQSASSIYQQLTNRSIKQLFAIHVYFIYYRFSVREANEVAHAMQRDISRQLPRKKRVIHWREISIESSLGQLTNLYKDFISVRTRRLNN